MSVLNGAAYVQLHGKGRKQRSVPLWRSSVLEIQAWLRLNTQMNADSALLDNRKGQKMTRSNVVQHLTTHHTAHGTRHTTTMHLLQSGVDISVIALWLGHESPMTAHMCVKADL